VTKIKLRGLKVYFSKGKRYVYHRATGARIKATLGTPEFIAEISAIEARLNIPAPLPGTWGGLVRAYKQSPRYQTDIKPRTRRDYDTILFWLKPLEGTALVNWNRSYVTRVQDKARQQRGTRFARYVTSVVSLIFTWGMARGFSNENPAEGVEKLRRPKDRPQANRPWTDAEWNVVWKRASPQVRAILALAGILGWRGGETIAAPRTCYDRKAKTITRVSSKSGRVVTSTVPPQVAKALNTLLPHDATTLLVNSRGKPWTENGFRFSVFKLLRQLEREKLVQKGLTIHGLRHTVATRARELGFAPRAIADTLGQETEGMALHYSKTADATRSVSEVVTKIAKNKKRTPSV
jgi:integrase